MWSDYLEYLFSCICDVMTGGNKSIYHAIDDLTKIHYKKKSTAIFSKCTIVRPNPKKLTIDMQIRKKELKTANFIF